MKFCKTDIDCLINLSHDKNVFLEGNILKVIDHEDNEEFKTYLSVAIKRDQDIRKKRLEITKQIQIQNHDLLKKSEENERISKELQSALKNVQEAKSVVENDLDVLQKKTQFELIGVIVKVALYVIVGIGLVSTIIYIISIITASPEAHDIGSAWVNLSGILLTNAFSIIGTIMGVKYASEKTK